MGHIGIHLYPVFMVALKPVGGRNRKDVLSGCFSLFGMNFQNMDFLGKKFWSKSFIFM